MESIAEDELIDNDDEEIEEERFNMLIEQTYNEIDLHLNMDFINMTFRPTNSHVSIWSYCTVCESYGHSDYDHWNCIKK